MRSCQWQVREWKPGGRCQSSRTVCLASSSIRAGGQILRTALSVNDGLSHGLGTGALAVHTEYVASVSEYVYRVEAAGERCLCKAQQAEHTKEHKLLLDACPVD